MSAALQCERDAPVADLFASWQELAAAPPAARTAEYWDRRRGLVVDILVAHPFVKVKEPASVVRGDYTFETQGFALDIRKFQKYLKAEPALKKIAGGVSDDGLYTVSSLLRVLMPRGLHQIVSVHGPSGATKAWLFRGIPKFTGLIETDEDEASNSTAAGGEDGSGGGGSVSVLCGVCAVCVLRMCPVCALCVLCVCSVCVYLRGRSSGGGERGLSYSAA